MNFVIIGTDHTLQSSNAGLLGLMRGLAEDTYVDRLVAVAEEYHSNLGETVAQRFKRELNLPWYNFDMTEQEKAQAGILEEQRARPCQTFRLASDDLREQAWVDKLHTAEPGTTLVVCGYLHSASLARKLREQGCGVDLFVYLTELSDCYRDAHVNR